MRLASGWMVGMLLFAAGCGDQGAKAPMSSGSSGSPAPVAQPASGDAGGATAETAASGEKTGGTEAARTDATASTEQALAGLRPVPIESGEVSLIPENTKITFVGTHAPPKAPDPRTGVFLLFNGKATVEGKDLKSLTVDIQTKSIATQFQQLTDHLNRADFFDTNEYPSAKFVSTKITPVENGVATITGNLTLLAATREISFPATVNITDKGLTLKAEFTIDRTEFGMDKLTEGVEKPVKLTATIGEKTEAPAPAGPPGGKKGRKKPATDE